MGICSARRHSEERVLLKEQPAKTSCSAAPILIATGIIVILGGIYLTLSAHHMLPANFNVTSQLGVWKWALGYGSIGVGISIAVESVLALRARKTPTDLNKQTKSEVQQTENQQTSLIEEKHTFLTIPIGSKIYKWDLKKSLRDQLENLDFYNNNDQKINGPYKHMDLVGINPDDGAYIFPYHVQDFSDESLEEAIQHIHVLESIHENIRTLFIIIPHRPEKNVPEDGNKSFSAAKGDRAPLYYYGMYYTFSLQPQQQFELNSTSGNWITLKIFPIKP